MSFSPTFLLRLFGSPSITKDAGVSVTGPATQRHRLALLALLALAPESRSSRDRLLAYLWPERDAEHARQLLNQAVYNLRKALGEEALLSAGEDLRLNTRVVGVDVLEFEAALGQGKHEAAAVLYRGPFLDGFFLSDASEFERWVDGSGTGSVEPTRGPWRRSPRRRSGSGTSGERWTGGRRGRRTTPTIRAWRSRSCGR